MENLQQQLAPLLSAISDNAYAQSAIIVMATLVLAKLLTVIVLGTLKRLTRHTETRLDDEVLEALNTPLVYSLVMVGLLIAVQLMPLEAPLKTSLQAVLKSIGIVVWTVFFIRLTKLLMRKAAHNDHPRRLLQTATLPLFENLAFIIFIAFAVYLIFNLWGIDMSAWLASAGIVGIAVGFAAKDTLANLFSGVFILADMPYKIGDYVVMDSGERGKVTEIGIRSTRLLTRDDVELTIPNSIMGNSKIINQSGGPHEKFRIRIPVGVAYGSDVDQVRQQLMDIAKEQSLTCTTPTPRVRFRTLGASSLDFELLAWVDRPALRGRVTDALLTTIYKRFNAEGIEIPYSKQDLYIKEWPQPPQASREDEH